MSLWVYAKALVMISLKLPTCLYQATNLQTHCLKKCLVLTVAKRRVLLFLPNCRYEDHPCITNGREPNFTNTQLVSVWSNYALGLITVLHEYKENTGEVFRFKTNYLWTREKTHLLRLLAALSKYLISVPNTHIRRHTITRNSRLCGSDVPLFRHTHTHRERHTHHNPHKQK